MEKTKKQKNRTRALVISIITIIICLALLAGGTYALWTKKVTVTNHLLVSGKMDLTLERVSLKKTTLDPTTGYMVTAAEDANVKDLVNTEASNYIKNAFSFADDGELIVPTSSYEAKLRITNTGNVAFSYNVHLKLDQSIYNTDTYKYSDYGQALAEQLQVTVYDANGDQKDQRYLSAFSTTDDGTVVIDKVYVEAKEKTSTFSVKIEFVNDNEKNNSAMSKKVSFDIIVDATQATSSNSNG